MEKISAVIKPRAPTMRCTLVDRQNGRLQTREVTPTDEEQTITPEEGWVGMRRVIVHKIPSNYGKITYDGEKIIVS